MDYYVIGQRIRKTRKAHGLSQEQLAELVGISTTHMSHIETGNTKLSLPVLVSLAEALEVSTDELLLQGSPTERGVSRSVMKRPIAPANEIAAGIQKHHFHAPTWLGPLPRVPMI